MSLIRSRKMIVFGFSTVVWIFGSVTSICDAQQTSEDLGNALAQHPLAAAFRKCDVDGDGLLTEAEYLKRGTQDAQILRRDFKVFDANRDARLSLGEFLAVPVGQPEDQRGAVADPIVILSELAFENIARRWEKSDKDHNRSLNVKEFETAEIGKLVRGLESTTFQDWDLNSDQAISRAETKQLLEMAFGVRTKEGELLRRKTGHVVHWSMFRSLKKNREGFVSLADYFNYVGALDNRQQWFDSIDKNGDHQFDYAEFAMSNHRTDPVNSFLQLDIDLNGRPSPEELDALPAEWYPDKQFLFPGFDDDKDGLLCLEEFQLAPVVNLLAVWQSANDTNNDGELSLEEFRFLPGVELRALCAEYFRRLDVDKNGFLSVDEFPFVTNSKTVSDTEIRARLPDGTVMIIAIPDYPIICSPEISPDGRWVAVDGWKHGQNNVAAHLLVASLESDEVRDLGIGCIPHWSADGRKLAYSKYGQGVFIGDFEEGAREEESIDQQGWSIHFSTDGLKVAYVLGGGNLVTYDLKTREKHLIFPQGESPYRYIEHNFAWSPDSKRIVFKGHRQNGTIDVGIVSTTDDDPNLKVRYDGKLIQSDFFWRAEGNQIMFPKLPDPGQKTQLFEFEADSDKPFVRFTGQPKNRNNGGLSWSRDGKVLVYMSTR